MTRYYSFDKMCIGSSAGASAILFCLAFSPPEGQSMASAKIYGNLIGGKSVPARSGKTFENLNPADTSDVVGIFASSDAADVDAAVQAAAKAYETWGLGPAPQRAGIV